MQQIGRYQIDGELGRGAMGIVYKAHDPAIGRTVAIKTIRLKDLSDQAERERLRERLFREAQSAGILSHPGIVTIYDIAEADGLAYIFMECVDGPSLEKLIASGKMPDRAGLLAIFRQVAEALDYAHKKGIVHRDIKPGNIMIDSSGGAKITDFGVAKILSQEMTQAGMMMGTPNYMSPEQIQGGAISGLTDQFALAVIVYELLTGQKPFQADQMPALMFKILRNEPTAPEVLNSALDPSVGVVLRRGLAKMAEDRYDTCAAFVQALAEGLAKSPAWVLPASLSGRTSAKTGGDTGGGSASGTSASETDDAWSLEATREATPGETSTIEAMLEGMAQAQTGSGALEETVAVQGRAGDQGSGSMERSGMERSGMNRSGMERTGAPVIAHTEWQVRRGSENEASNHRGRNLALVALLLAAAGGGGYWWITQQAAVPVNGEQVVLTEAGSPPGQTAAPPQTTPAALDPVSGQVEESSLQASRLPITGTTDRTTADRTKTDGATTARTPEPAAASNVTASPTAPPRVPTEGTFELTTNPVGAQVTYDNDASLRCTTPCTVTLASGRHAFQVAKEGYRSMERVIYIPDDTGLILDLPALAGTLRLNTVPPGLRVLVDGREQAGQTPLSLRLPVGTHTVVVLNGALREQVSVTIRDNTITTQTISWE